MTSSSHNFSSNQPSTSPDAAPAPVNQPNDYSGSRSNPDATIHWSRPFPADAQPPSAVDPSSGPTFGDYELIEEIARGGMGIVYRARHRRLNRIVALKKILAAELASPDDVARFHAEASAAALLDHRGIVPIHEFGELDGRHYYTMGFVDGPSLADRIQQGPLSNREAATILREVADAVAYAHSQGIVHRDLKPANVLLARIDPANSSDSSLHPSRQFAPRVTDFGLAKRVSAERGLTMTGQVVGTPSYMAPEQAAGRSADVGPPSDIYALGAILYEMLTGRPPFHAATPLETLQQVLESAPAAPRLLNPSVDRDLEIICLKCLEKSASHRYESTGELVQDLDRYLEGEPIAARRVNVVRRVVYALRKRRHEVEFGGWGRAVLCAGLIILGAHLAIFVLQTLGLGQLTAYWAPRTIMFALLLLTLIVNRPHTVMPTNAAERLIWSIWFGFFLSLFTTNAIIAVLGLPLHISYAVSLLLGGLCFFIMGSQLWGGCYAIGITFLVAAPWVALAPRFAPLVDGLFWGVALSVIGARYWPVQSQPETEVPRA